MKGFLEVIKFEGDNHQLVWKHPAEDFNTHSTLIVNEGQVALFYKNGQIADVFEAGRYVLSTQNIPLLRKIIEIPTGGESPFSCHVYFVNMVEAMDIKWGLPSKATWEDPKYGIMVSVGARGNLSLRVDDPANMVINLVGAEVGLRAEDLTKYFRDLITMRTKAYLARTVEDQGIDVFHLDSNMELIADELKKKFVKDFAEYGFKLKMFTISEFVLPLDDPSFQATRRAHDEVYKTLKHADTARQEAIIAADASAQAEVLRAQGHAAALSSMGTDYVTTRKLDIAENMSKNQSMNQFSGLAGSMAMMGGAMSMGVQTASAIGNAMNATGANNMAQAANPYAQANPYAAAPQQPQQQTPPTDVAPSSGKICMKCGKSVPAEALFCLFCGATMPKACSKCGAVLMDGAMFCMKCGAKVEA